MAAFCGCGMLVLVSGADMDHPARHTVRVRRTGREKILATGRPP